MEAARSDAQAAVLELAQQATILKLMEANDKKSMEVAPCQASVGKTHRREIEELDAEDAAPDPDNSLRRLLLKCLTELGMEERLVSTLLILQSEWYFTAEDLTAALEDVNREAWQELKLPGRLKISIKRELTAKPQHLDTTPQSAEIDENTHRWVKCFSPDHNSIYYYNTVTEETLWTLPEGVDASALRDDPWSMAALQGCLDNNDEEETGGDPRDDEEEEKDDARWAILSNEADYRHNDMRTASSSLSSPSHSQAPNPSAPMLPDYEPGLIHCVSAYHALPVAVVVSAEATYDGDGVGDGQQCLDDDDVYGEEEELGEDEDDEENDVGESNDEEEGSEGDAGEEKVWGEDEFLGAWSNNGVVPNPTNVRRLREMGFSEADSIRALKCCQNQLSDAAALLVTRKSGNSSSSSSSSSSSRFASVSSMRGRLDDAGTIGAVSPPPPFNDGSAASAQSSAAGRLSGLFPRLGSKVRGILNRNSISP